MRDFEERNRNFTDMLSRNIKRLNTIQDAWPTERKAPNHDGPDKNHGYDRNLKGELNVRITVLDGAHSHRRNTHRSVSISMQESRKVEP